MKRANGEGCISKYGDKWRGRFTDPVSRRQRSVYGATQKECKEKLDAMLETIRKGQYVAPTVETTATWLDTWFSSYYCIGTKQSTQASAHNDIKVLKGYIGSIPLQSRRVNDHPEGQGAETGAEQGGKAEKDTGESGL